SWIRQREDTIVVNGVASTPAMIVFDDGNHILKKLMFEQPSAQLAAQLRRDPDLWNRSWVIQQLALRATDPVAQSALADAATGSDYFLTRVAAASALGSLAPSAAIPALTRALRDTSSQVRQAAVEALGRVGGPDATTLARSAWRDDSSYGVRAAALPALARLDTTGRRALLLQGLRTPSYQDAIQNAAIGAAVRSDDSSFVAPMQAIVGDQQLPSFGLAQRSQSVRSPVGTGGDRPIVRRGSRPARAKEHSTVFDACRHPRRRRARGEADGGAGVAERKPVRNGQPSGCRFAHIMTSFMSFARGVQ
ncbi:MAG: HEAT repeat domain-containing protein, partial [Gemmatimonadetes bacterium]|nr:HEAT repeat domain-containing protein [Gemmatimonadota bacterium]